MQTQWLYLSQFAFVAFALVLAGLTLGRPQTRWFGVFFLAIGLHGAFSRLPFAADTLLDKYSYAMAFAYGPLMYLSLRGLLRIESFRAINLLVVIVPVLLAVALVASDVSSQILGILLTVVQLMFVVGGLRELRRYAEVVEQSRSVDAGQAIRWVSWALWIYAGFVLVLALRSALAAILTSDTMASINLSVSVGIAVTLAFLTARVLREPGWIPRVTEAERNFADELSNEASEPAPEQLAMAEELNDFLLSKRPYLDPELTVGKLSAELGWSARQLSEVINRAERVSFSRKINAMRVDEAKRLLADPAMTERSVLDIGLSAGFNSKSAFNLMFKRFAGCTPREFRQILAK